MLNSGSRDLFLVSVGSRDIKASISCTMVKYALTFAALAASASAFAPASVSNAKSGLDAFANGYVGNEGPEPMPPPFNSVDFDPFGFTEV